MNNLTRWTRPAMRTLRRDLDEILEDFQMPRDLRRELDRVFEDAESSGSLGQRIAQLASSIAEATGISRRAGALFAPDTKILSERKDAYVVRVDLPGVRDSDIDVRVDGDMLIISGDTRTTSFTRGITLPLGADPSRIHAEMKNGVLEVRLPKSERGRTRQIPIRRREQAARGVTTRIEPRVQTPGRMREEGKPSQLDVS